MQTRKKSISLHALGVIPSTPRGSATHRSSTSSSSANNASASDSHSHPPKRLKRSHTLSGSASSPKDSNSPTAAQRNGNSPSAKDQQTSHPITQATPPPSPDDFPTGKVDKSGINDDIVVAVLEQLEATGNRPHLIKELATIFANSLHSVKRQVPAVAPQKSRH